MTRSLVALLLIVSTAHAGPYKVTRGPRFEVTSPGTGQQQSEGSSSPCRADAAGQSLPVLCVKIAGVDHDMDVIEAEYRRAWTWPGMTEASLRQHLREHQVDASGLTYEQCQKVHAVIHERELSAGVVRAKVNSPVSVRQPVTRSSCPGGVCPAPGWSSRSSRPGLQRRWR